MLVVYCFRNTMIFSAPFGILEFLSILIVIIIQAWKRNSLMSILVGTVVYMLLMQYIF